MSEIDDGKLWQRTNEGPDTCVQLAETSLQESVLSVARSFIEDERPGDSERTEPRYLVVLDGDARDLVSIAGFMTPEDEVEGDAKPIYGSIQWDDDLIVEWAEPAVGILLSESRDHRWALVSEIVSEHVTPTYIDVLKIAGDSAQLELLCSHPDARIFDLREEVVVHE